MENKNVRRYELPDRGFYFPLPYFARSWLVHLFFASGIRDAPGKPQIPNSRWLKREKRGETVVAAGEKGGLIDSRQRRWIGRAREILGSLGPRLPLFKMFGKELPHFGYEDPFAETMSVIDLT